MIFQDQLGFICYATKVMPPIT